LKEVDEKFKKAIRALIAYEAKYHTIKIVAKRMEKAKAGDKPSSKLLNRLKENFRVRGELAHLLSSCRDTNADRSPAAERGTNEDSRISSSQVPS
jgi:hypothetical protein